MNESTIILLSFEYQLNNLLKCEQASYFNIYILFFFIEISICGYCEETLFIHMERSEHKPYSVTRKSLLQFNKPDPFTRMKLLPICE